MYRQREKGDGKGKSKKGSGKGKNPNTDTCNCCGEPGHHKPDCRHRNENCGACGMQGHASQACRSGQSTNASARAVEVDSEDAEEDPIKDTHDVWAVAVCTKIEHTVHESSADNVNTWSPEQTGNALGSRCYTLPRCVCEVRRVTTWEFCGASYLRGKSGKQAVEITALMADEATKSLSGQRRTS